MKRVMSHVPGFDSYTKPLFKTVHKMQFRINMMTPRRWRAESRRLCERVVGTGYCCAATVHWVWI